VLHYLTAVNQVILCNTDQLPYRWNARVLIDCSHIFPAQWRRHLPSQPPAHTGRPSPNAECCHYLSTAATNNHQHPCTHTHTQPFYGSQQFVFDNPVKPVPEETFTHSHIHTYHGLQSSLICFLHLLRSTASSLFSVHAWQSFYRIHLQSFHWFSWPGTLHFIVPKFLQPITYFFSQHMSIPSQPVMLQCQDYVI